jgi:hypothetical protein
MRRYEVNLFQLMTFTSLSCADIMPATLLRPFVRTSQIWMLWSAEQDAKTVGSDGLHCKSSTLDVCEVNGCDKALNPDGVEVVRKILECISPVNNRRDEDPEEAQSIAKPSARPCELIVNVGVFVRDFSKVNPGTSSDSISGRMSQMCTLPVSAHVATWYGWETSGSEVECRG